MSTYRFETLQLHAGQQIDPTTRARADLIMDFTANGKLKNKKLEIIN